MDERPEAGITEKTVTVIIVKYLECHLIYFADEVSSSVANIRHLS